MGTISSKSPVGINGIGRIGKLLAWVMSTKDDLEEIVISTGRKTGKSVRDFATYMAYDSTYGPYSKFLFGFRKDKAFAIKDDTLYLNGKKIVWLNESQYRAPGKIPWSKYGVEMVFDTTGKMTDPTSNEDNSLRGHLNNAKKIILTAPFKIKNKGAMMPEDAITVVGGVNFDKYDPAIHKIISNASCTTNCCAPPIKALVEHFGEKFVSYALTTVHASTNSQKVLDTLPKDGDKDCRKTRSIMNNIIPSTTGAANAVIEVIPQIRELGIGSQASSLRVPTNTASIVILDISLIGEYDNDYIHGIFRKYSERNPEIMSFSDRQLVSSDLIGSTFSTVYDSLFTHRRTTKRDDKLYTMADLNFWYDNEFGYVCSLERLYNLIIGKR
jgi:glyceraldehyde 3-phosphate dehydrogenase